jgi:hypothetical protein
VRGELDQRLLNQLAAVLATGNRALVLAEGRDEQVLEACRRK